MTEHTTQPPHQDQGEIERRVRELLERFPVKVSSANGYDAAWAAGFNDAVDLCREDAIRAISIALTEAKQQGNGTETPTLSDCSKALDAAVDVICECTGERRGHIEDDYRFDHLYDAAKRIMDIGRTLTPQGEAKQQAPAAVPDGMLLIQKTDAECLVRDAERFIGVREGTVGGRLARKRVRALLAATPAACEGESRNG